MMPLEFSGSDASTAPTDPELAQLAVMIQQLADDRTGDCLALLALLRKLEERHQLIRETLFREALPDNRQVLYRLLREIEVSGGWPYIKRMTLKELLYNLYEAEASNGEAGSG